MRSTGAAHVGRAVSSAPVVVLLSLAFHLLAGGSVPSTAAVGRLTVVVAVAATVLTRRPARPGSLVALLAVGQLALHLGFEAGAHHVHHHGSPLPMLATHALATTLTALVLRYGQALLRLGLARAVRSRLRAPRPVRFPPRGPVALTRPVPPPAPGTGAASGRAPPVPVHR